MCAERQSLVVLLPPSRCTGGLHCRARLPPFLHTENHAALCVLLAPPCLSQLLHKSLASALLAVRARAAACRAGTVHAGNTTPVTHLASKTPQTSYLGFRAVDLYNVLTICLCILSVLSYTLQGFTYILQMTLVSEHGIYSFPFSDVKHIA